MTVEELKGVIKGASDAIGYPAVARRLLEELLARLDREGIRPTDEPSPDGAAIHPAAILKDLPPGSSVTIKIETF